MSWSLRSGIFETGATPISGGIFYVPNTDLVPTGMYAVEELYISPEDWQVMKESPQGEVLINTNGTDVRKSFISNFTRNIVTGKTKIETIFTRRQLFK
jgi:hypothetical protein